jgi:hypothetical protein
MKMIDYDKLNISVANQVYASQEDVPFPLPQYTHDLNSTFYAVSLLPDWRLNLYKPSHYPNWYVYLVNVSTIKFVCTKVCEHESPAVAICLAIADIANTGLEQTNDLPRNTNIQIDGQ